MVLTLNTNIAVENNEEEQEFCRICGTELSEGMLHKDICDDCEEEWFCRICGKELETSEYDKGQGICNNCETKFNVTDDRP